MMAFIIAAGLMTAIALAFVLVPLHQHQANNNPSTLAQRRLHALKQALDAGIIDSKEFATKSEALDLPILPASNKYSPRLIKNSAVLIALLLPAAAIGLYSLLGTPEALDSAKMSAMQASAQGHGMDLQKAAQELAEKLKETPADAEGWALLGRTYKTLQQMDEALDAYKHAYALLPDNVDITLGYVEALALTKSDHRIDADSHQLIERALTINPNNQLGLWLLGISDYQAGAFDKAIASWTHLLNLLPKGSDEAQSIQQQITRAQQQAGESGSAPTTIAENTPTPANTSADNISPKLTIHVQIDEKLRDKLEPNDTLFVFAKAANGPAMPLAIQRLNANQLPTTVILDESKGMVPTMKLSMFPQLTIGARVSKSGDAIARSGDLQALPQPVRVDRKEPVELTIDQVIP